MGLVLFFFPGKLNYIAKIAGISPKLRRNIRVLPKHQPTEVKNFLFTSRDFGSLCKISESQNLTINQREIAQLSNLKLILLHYSAFLSILLHEEFLSEMKIREVRTENIKKRL